MDNRAVVRRLFDEVMSTGSLEGLRMPSGTPRSSALVALLFSLAVSSLGCSVPPGPTSRPATAEIAALKLQAEAWDSAIIRKDFAAIADNMTPDFRQIRRNGSIVNRETFLRDITSPDLVIDPYTVEDFDVRLYGDVALLCGRTRMTGRFQGESFTSHYRYIDTYVRQDGKWRVCSVQITAIPEGRSE